MTDKILMLIPCYNCEPQIGRVLAQFDEKSSAYFFEILLLDNGSLDGTVGAAVQAARRLPHLPIVIGKNRANYNLGGSHKVAFQYAQAHGFTHVAVLHGDDQGSLRDLLAVLQRGRHRTADACLGARFMPGSRLIGYSRFRIFGNRVFNAIYTAGTRTPIRDLGSGLNIFGKSVFGDARVVRYADDLRFNVYLLLGMLGKKLTVEYFPISWREEDQVSNVKMTSQALQTLGLLWQSMTGGPEFWLKDHRALKHASYEFDVIYPS